MSISGSARRSQPAPILFCPTLLCRYVHQAVVASVGGSTPSAFLTRPGSSGCGREYAPCAGDRCVVVIAARLLVPRCATPVVKPPHWPIAQSVVGPKGNANRQRLGHHARVEAGHIVRSTTTALVYTWLPVISSSSLFWLALRGTGAVWRQGIGEHWPA